MENVLNYKVVSKNATTDWGFMLWPKFFEKTHPERFEKLPVIIKNALAFADILSDDVFAPETNYGVGSLDGWCGFVFSLKYPEHISEKVLSHFDEFANNYVDILQKIVDSYHFEDCPNVQALIHLPSKFGNAILFFVPVGLDLIELLETDLPETTVSPESDYTDAINKEQRYEEMLLKVDEALCTMDQSWEATGVKFPHNVVDDIKSIENL